MRHSGRLSLFSLSQKGDNSYSNEDGVVVTSPQLPSRERQLDTSQSVDRAGGSQSGDKEVGGPVEIDDAVISTWSLPGWQTPADLFNSARSLTDWSRGMTKGKGMERGKGTGKGKGMAMGHGRVLSSPSPSPPPTAATARKRNSSWVHSLVLSGNDFGCQRKI
jgi:hypothetical protein